MNVVALWCVAALALLLFGLGMAVSGWRFRDQRLYGFDPDPGDMLYKLVRAHGNTAEYAPLLAILILFLGAHDPSPWVVGVMAAATVSRYLLVLGIVAFPTVAKPNVLRFIGAAGTYSCGILLAMALLRLA